MTPRSSKASLCALRSQGFLTLWVLSGEAGCLHSQAASSRSRMPALPHSLRSPTTPIQSTDGLCCGTHLSFNTLGRCLKPSEHRIFHPLLSPLLLISVLTAHCWRLYMKATALYSTESVALILSAEPSTQTPTRGLTAGVG